MTQLQDISESFLKVYDVTIYVKQKINNIISVLVPDNLMLKIL